MAGLDRGGKRHVVNSHLENLRNLAPADRFGRVADVASLDTGERAAFSAAAPTLMLANGMIENVIGRFELPVGIATNFTVNGHDYPISMATEGERLN